MDRALDRLEDALASIAAAMIVFTVVFVPMDVASRYFFAAPITWVYEVTEYILLMVPCLAMAWLARHNGHVAIDALTSRLPDGPRARLAGFTQLIVAGVCAFVAWWGGVVTLGSFKAGAGYLSLDPHLPDGRLLDILRAARPTVLLTDEVSADGSLKFMPKSHRTFVACPGETPDTGYREAFKKQAVGKPPALFLDLLEENGGVQEVVAPAGSVLLFDCNVMHGAGKNTSDHLRANLFYVYNAVSNALNSPYAATRSASGGRDARLIWALAEASEVRSKEASRATIVSTKAFKDDLLKPFLRT